MKLYVEDFEVVDVISIPENIYESEERFDIFKKSLKIIAGYHFENVKNNFVKAVIDYCRSGKHYIVVRFKEYYGLIQIIDIDLKGSGQCEVNDQIKCFDENQVYPIQGIRKTIDWVY